jgi:hypothetical protein
VDIITQALAAMTRVAVVEALPLLWWSYGHSYGLQQQWITAPQAVSVCLSSTVVCWALDA